MWDTIASVNRKIIKHFSQADPVLHGALQKLDPADGDLGPSSTTDYFSDLCEAIVNQQLSEKAGRTIYTRFLELFPDRKPTPGGVAALQEQSLRGVGMSWSKAQFIKSLASSFINNEIDFVKIRRLSDAEAIGELTRLHGVGQWTAEMFLMFSLGRPDVFSYGDVGLRRAMMRLYGFKKDPTEKQLRLIVQKWSPYKTYACRILWRSLDAVNIVQ